MSVRGRLLHWKKAVSGGGGILENNPDLSRVLGYVLHFLMGLVMASARIFDVSGPFGIGIVAQAGAGASGLICLIGACVGYFFTGGFDWGIKYVATVVLVYTASFLFQETKVYKKTWFMPAVTVGITAVTAFINSFDIFSPIPAIVISVTEIILAGGTAYFFSIALSGGDRTTETGEIIHGVSLLIFLSCALMAIAKITIFETISLGRILAVLIVMTTAYKGRVMAGAAAGAAMGLAMDISSGGAPFYTMAYAVSGLFSGVFSKNSKLVFLLSYVLANAVSVLWTWGEGMRVEILYEAFIASVVFMAIPSSALGYIGGIFYQRHAGEGEAGLRRYSADRVQRMSEAFQDLYETVRYTMEGGTNDNDIATVFDRAADSVCVHCKCASNCWQEHYIDTLNAMNDATAAMLHRGRLEVDDLPEYFKGTCENPTAFVSAVNGELRGLMYRRQYKSRLSENRAAAYGQYADLAAIMEGIAEELDAPSGPDPLRERRLLRYLQSIEVDAYVSAFRDRSGRLRVIIEGTRLSQLTRETDYLDRLSKVLGVPMCCPDSDVNRGEGRLVLTEAEPLAVSVGIAATKKKGEPVSGDRGTYFKTDQGVLCVILSDGMGTGEEAAKESVAAVRILERFLRSGVEPSTAMKILNSVMLLKNGEDWGYATVDLVCIDLFTGEACFYKYGAAPSYVRSGKMIRRVRCENFAAGMCVGEGGMPDVVRMRLKPGSLAVIASDGVLAEKNDAWLRAMMSSFDGTDTKALAKHALESAMNQYGCEDDMTVLAVYVDKRQ